LQHGEKSRRQSDIFIGKRCFIEGDATRASKKSDGSRHRHGSLACAHYRGIKENESPQETTRLDSGPINRVTGAKHDAPRGIAAHRPQGAIIAAIVP
jgi:hypothetical protein